MKYATDARGRMVVPKKITPAEALAHLRGINNDKPDPAPGFGDPHAFADDILLALLRHLGHTKIVAEWKKVDPKYYA